MSNFNLEGGVLGRLLDPDMLLEAGVVSAGAGLGSLAYNTLVDLVRVKPEGAAEGSEERVPLLDTPLKRLGGALGVGLLGGWGAWMLNEDMGKGLVGAMMGQAGTELYNLVTGQANVRLARGEGESADAFKTRVNDAQLRGLSGGFGRFGDASVLMNRATEPLAQLADAAVEDVDDFMPPGEDFDLGTVSSIVAS